jgi:WD40 repeat protein
MKFLRNRICSVILLIILSLLLSPGRADALSPWILKNGEKIITGTYSGYENNQLYLTSQDKGLTMIMESDPVIAIMGTQTGTLIELDELPQGTNIEVFINKEGKVRALRNQREAVKEATGVPLEAWGHEASLSPDGRKFTIYHYLDGLSLHDLKDPAFTLNISPFSLCAWNKNGSKLAYAAENGLSILELDTKKITNVPLGLENAEITKVITSIQWSPQEDWLLVISLDDVPDAGSDIFTLTVLDLQGNIVIQKFIPCLGPVFWLSQDEILMVTFSDISMKTADIKSWNINNDTFRSLFTSVNLTNISYNPLQKVLAFSIRSGIKEDIFTYDLEHNKLDKKISLLSSIRNLQWTRNNALFFWQELNNSICELTQENLLKIHFSGYLPQNAVEDKILYFLTEPLEENQQVYMQKIK